MAEKDGEVPLGLRILGLFIQNVSRQRHQIRPVSIRLVIHDCESRDSRKTPDASAENGARDEEDGDGSLI